MQKIKQWVKDHKPLVLEVAVVGGITVLGGAFLWKQNQKFMTQVNLAEQGLIHQEAVDLLELRFQEMEAAAARLDKAIAAKKQAKKAA